MLPIRFAESAAELIGWWERTNPKVDDNGKPVLRDAREHPVSGLGKPEPPNENLSGFWFRRITGEHRLVYGVRWRPGNTQAKFRCARGRARRQAR